MVDRKGFEPLTPRMPCAYSTSLNYRPSIEPKRFDFLKNYQHLTQFELG